MYNFTDEEIKIIIHEWFSKFDGFNVNIQNDNPIWNTIYMHFFMLQRHQPEWYIRDIYLSILYKLATNPNYNFNLPNKAWSTIISNLIQLWNFEALKFILENWKNIQCKYWESRFWDRYIDLALAFRKQAPYEIDKIIELLKQYE